MHPEPPRGVGRLRQSGPGLSPGQMAVPAPRPHVCVVLGKSLPLSEAQFPRRMIRLWETNQACEGQGIALAPSRRSAVLAAALGSWRCRPTGHTLGGSTQRESLHSAAGSPTQSHWAAATGSARPHRFPEALGNGCLHAVPALPPLRHPKPPVAAESLSLRRVLGSPPLGRGLHARDSWD